MNKGALLRSAAGLISALVSPHDTMEVRLRVRAIVYHAQVYLANAQDDTFTHFDLNDVERLTAAHKEL